MLTITLEEIDKGKHVTSKWRAIVFESLEDAVNGFSVNSDKYSRPGVGTSTYDPLAAITEALNDYNERNSK
jgi:hypothetical protein